MVPARIEALKVKNFRVLKDVELTDMTPFTVLLGPNGSGKSTIFDVFAFLSECFETNLGNAWFRRGGIANIRSRGARGPVKIEIRYKETGKKASPITYRLSINEQDGRPKVVEESLQWSRMERGRPYNFLKVQNGRGEIVSGKESEDRNEHRVKVKLSSQESLAVSTYGQLADHPRVVTLRNFITGWYVSHIAVDSCREQQTAGLQKRLSRTGDNLANVLQHLSERHGDRFKSIISALKERIPLIDDVMPMNMIDGKLLLQFKDTAFSDPVLAKFTSDGTLKMLAYLIVLHDPSPPSFIGIEEPENFLHPRLLEGLANECSMSTERTQVLATTHSPQFVNALRPEEVRVLWRDSRTGFAKITPVDKIPVVPKLIKNGAQLGEIWMENHFKVGDPLNWSAAPSNSRDGVRA